MKRATSIMLIPVLSVVLAGLCLAAGGHVLSNPLAATAPPSSYGGSRLYSSSPIDSRSNLVVTGNVRAGRSFKPGVPYYGRTDFHGTLGSTGLDSFIRDSAGSESWRSRSSQPYFFSGTRTVPTTQPGRKGVFSPSAASGKTTEVYGLDEPAGAMAGSTSAKPAFTLSFFDADHLTTQETTGLAQNVEAQDATSLANTRFKAWRERAGEQLQPSQTDAVAIDEFGRPLTQLEMSELAAEVMADQVERSNEGMLERSTDNTISRRSESETGPEAVAPGKAAEETSFESLEELSVEDILAQIQKDLSDTAGVSGGEDEGQGDGSVSVTAGLTTESSGERRYFTLYGSDRMQKIAELSGEEMDDLKAEEQTYNFKKRKSSIEEVGSMSREELASEAQEIMGPYTDVAAYNEARFREKFQEAAIYLRQGRYNRAAGAFEAALLYCPGHPAAYVGRALALFANGEYASSALFLSRALSSRPAYASTQVDLVTALGGREKLDSRIAELEQWLSQSDDGEYEYLLAYIYYQTGQYGKARIAINTAVRRMANQAAVAPLKEEIERAIAGSQK